MSYKRYAIVAAVAGALIAPGTAHGASASNEPTGAPPVPANCLGAWRHLQTSASGEWAHGEFGGIHVATVQAVVAQGMPFGEWLAQWKAQNC